MTKLPNRVTFYLFMEVKKIK